MIFPIARIYGDYLHEEIHITLSMYRAYVQNLPFYAGISPYSACNHLS